MKKLEVVVTDCRDCHWKHHPGRSHACGHPDVMSKDKYRMLNGICPIPDWCPLDDFINEDIVEPGC